MSSLVSVLRASRAAYTDEVTFVEEIEAMPSKYGFETPEDRERQRKEYEQAAMDSHSTERRQLTAKRMRIEAAVIDILQDYAAAQGWSTQIDVKVNPVTGHVIWTLGKSHPTVYWSQFELFLGWDSTANRIALTARDRMEKLYLGTPEYNVNALNAIERRHKQLATLLLEQTGLPIKVELWRDWEEPGAGWWQTIVTME